MDPDHFSLFSLLIAALRSDEKKSGIRNLVPAANLQKYADRQKTWLRLELPVTARHFLTFNLEETYKN